MDLPRHMTTFVRIAETGSISQAARALRLSVAMASRHLRALEKELGVELIRRTTRRLTLTEAGTNFLVRARAALAGLHEARESVRPGRGASGLLVVSLPVSLGLARIGPSFPALLDQHPRLKLDLRFEDRFVDLLGDGIDVAIRAGVGPPDSPFIIARKLASVERVLCVAPEFLAKHAKISTVESLSNVPCVLQGPAPTQWSFLSTTGTQTWVPVDGRFRTNNVFALREAALAGAGVARLPSWLVDDDIRRKRLVRVLPSIAMPQIDVFGMFHQGSKGSAAIQVLLGFLQNELPGRMKATVSWPTRRAD